MSFQFKQFFIDDDRCAMKVGTDSILLGSWVALDGVQTVLDMGCGCGILSLMLAQRLQGQPHFAIAALEIDPTACQQARENVASSPWAERISVIHDDAARFAPAHLHAFDLIVANPPYFPLGMPCRSARREQARYVGNSALNSHLDWLLCAKAMLRAQGAIALVLPYEAGLALSEQSAVYGLYCHARLVISSTPQKAPRRVLLRFGLQEKICAQQTLVIHDGGDYSREYQQLTGDFYLRF
ncbi:methyltransferase [Pasteurellaceae bacterium HPA106]|uniref:tRNA1(Val) (adenine(37)-N6)-methyltransferase n=1 Tax=Spirabiliibacterium pneumoniae TaxID=221400 RepID=UPI001AAC91F9|nr:methyltransferase [Spirabiliibacterium pneumoniae]MBE2897091.1 methyltransferase [Spirabiliibacterium pneumoniae]